MLKFMSGFFAVLILSLGINPAFSQSTEQRETIIEIIEATHALDQFKAMREFLPQQIEQQMMISGAQVSPEQLAIIQQVTLEMYDDMEADIMAITIRLYLNNFSQDELEDLLAFYRSDTGIKLAEKTPEMVNQIMTEVNTLLVQMMPGMQQKMRERLQALEAESERESES